MLSCPANRNNLGNFGRGPKEEHLRVVLKLIKWFRRRCRLFKDKVYGYWTRDEDL